MAFKKIALAALASVMVAGAATAGSITINNQSNALVSISAENWKELTQTGDNIWEGKSAGRHGGTVETLSSHTVSHNDKFTVWVSTNSWQQPQEIVVWPDENWQYDFSGHVFFTLKKNLYNKTPVHSGGHGGGHVRHVDD